jgi:hypothetical protein
MVENHHKGDKKGRPKKGQKMNNLQEPKKWKKTNPSCDKKLFHPHAL